MSRIRVFFFSPIVAAIAVLVGSCSPGSRSPTSVTAQKPSADLLGSVTDVVGSVLSATGLLQCRPLPHVLTSKTIGREGGVIQVGPHTLTIPEGALEEPVTITAELPVAHVNAVRFWPQGLEFEESATLSMSYANCSLLGRLLPKRIAYTTDNFNIISYLLSLDIFPQRRVTGRVDHFSTYAVAW
jgi:hypothetical protein